MFEAALKQLRKMCYHVIVARERCNRGHPLVHSGILCLRQCREKSELAVETGQWDEFCMDKDSNVGPVIMVEAKDTVPREECLVCSYSDEELHLYEENIAASKKERAQILQALNIVEADIDILERNYAEQLPGNILANLQQQYNSVEAVWDSMGQDDFELKCEDMDDSELGYQHSNATVRPKDRRADLESDDSDYMGESEDDEKWIDSDDDDEDDACLQEEAESVKRDPQSFAGVTNLPLIYDDLIKERDSLSNSLQLENEALIGLREVWRNFKNSVARDNEKQVRELAIDASQYFKAGPPCYLGHDVSYGEKIARRVAGKRDYPKHFPTSKTARRMGLDAYGILWREDLDDRFK